jgi:hypothetical protein
MDVDSWMFHGSVTVAGKYRLVSIRRPKGIMQSQRLPIELEEIVASAFGRTFNIPIENSPVLEGDRLFVITDNNDCAVAYASVKNVPTQSGLCMFVESIAVKAEHQHEGFGKMMLKRAMEKSVPEFIICLTQNPIMYELLEEVTKTIYPMAEVAFIPNEIRTDVQNALKAAKMDMNLDLDEIDFTATNVYSECPYIDGVVPRSDDESTNNLFASGLWTDTTGALLLIAYVNKK